MITITDEYKRAIEIAVSGKNLLITGDAGTGKSTLLPIVKLALEKMGKLVVVAAPTGRAAINVQGTTIHKAFGLKTGILDNEVKHKKEIEKTLCSVNAIILDECSMVRADTLDAIDRVCKKSTKNNAPFGGIQLIMVGDLMQLPPVLKQDEADAFLSVYKNAYFWFSEVYPKSDFQMVNLTQIFRQTEAKQKEFLNNIRFNKVTEKTMAKLNEVYCKPSELTSDYVILCATNEYANEYNNTMLQSIAGKSYTYEAVEEGSFFSDKPVPKSITLKVGAKVMIRRNGKENKYVNGTMASVACCNENNIDVQIDDTGEIVNLTPEKWEAIEYKAIDRTSSIKATIFSLEQLPQTDEIKSQIQDLFKELLNPVRIERQVVGAYYQIPVTLAAAITIHASQGMTFDKVAVDFRQYYNLAHGQCYVALSRIRNLKNIIFMYPINVKTHIYTDMEVITFLNKTQHEKSRLP